MKLPFYLFWTFFFTILYFLVEFSFYFTFTRDIDIPMLLIIIIFGFSVSILLHSIYILNLLIKALQKFFKEKWIADFIIKPFVLASIYFYLPTFFIAKYRLLDIRNKIYLASLLIAAGVYLFTVLALFVPKRIKQIALFFIGFGFLIGGGWMYVNQYHFLHQAMFFYASYPLYSFALTFYDKEKITFPIGKSVILFSLASLMIFIIPDFLASSGKYRYRGMLKTTYMKYHLAHFLKKNYRLSPRLIYTHTDKSIWKAKSKTFFNPVLKKKDEPKIQGMIFVLIDAFRSKNLKMYGYSKNTAPFLEKFAKENIIFQNHYAQHSSTVPSLNSIFRSDISPFVYSKYSLKSLKKDDKVKLATIILHDNSFRYHYFKKYILKKQNPNKAFHLAEKFLKKRIEDKKKFILFIHIMNVHTPYRKHKEFDYGSCPEDRYDSEISYVDKSMGKFLSFFSNSALKKSSWLIVSADHGEEFREHGGRHHTESVYDEIMHVPFISSIPGIKTKGLKVNIESAHTDLMPTIIYYLSSNPKKYPKHFFWQPRENLIELARLTDNNRINDFFPKGRFVYSHTIKHFFLGPTWSIVNENYKLITRYRSGIEELYNLQKDPDEKDNLLVNKLSPDSLNHYNTLKTTFWKYYINIFKYERSKRKKKSYKYKYY